MTYNISWIEYPDNLPKRDGEYLVSPSGFVGISSFSRCLKSYDKQGNKIYIHGWEDSNLGGIYEDVDAFMELPKAWSKK